MSEITWDQISAAGIDVEMVSHNTHSDLYTLTRPDGAGRVVFGESEDVEGTEKGGFDLAVYDAEDGIQRQEWAATVPEILAVVAEYAEAPLPVPAASTSITVEQVKALRDEAGQAGDTAQVEICDAALEGDGTAWATCENVIADAAAMGS